MAQHDTWTGRTLGEPTQEQWEALKRFAAAHGRNWKQALRDAWMQADYPRTGLEENDAAYLQQVRNTFGPRWLTLIRIDDPR